MRVEAWFAARGWRPFDFQREAWRAYLAGHSGLIHAPTGTGKTHAAWLGSLIEHLDGDDSTPGSRPQIEPKPGRARRSSARDRAAPLSVLWITPLRALASDTVESLLEPVRDLGLNWVVEKRTGDTPSSLRGRQRVRLPTCLVTTPESASVLLSYPDSRQLLSSVRCVIVDEWHELIGSKRGVQTELVLARLRDWNPGIRTWGVSATLGNIEEAAQVLLGPNYPVERRRLVRGLDPKPVVIDTVLPEDATRFPWAGHLGLTLLEPVLKEIQRARTTLLFTNTRSQAESWFRAIVNARPDWLGEVALHHGSLDRAIRTEVESRLRRDGHVESFRCVVCTSSLDLGVDFKPVDQVIQVGSPKGAARLLQRAGRSGHRPGAVSRVVCVPTHAFELMEFAGARTALQRLAIESRQPLEALFDVLVQHLVTVASGGGFVDEELRSQVRATHAFRNLTDEQWVWAIDFVRRGGPSLTAYPRYARIVQGQLAAGGWPLAGNDGQEGPDSDRATSNGENQGPVAGRQLPVSPRWVVASREIERRHRMSIGTITSDSALRVQYVRGRTLGTIEEGFIARLRPGERFAFAGRVLELVRVRDMTAFVRRAKGSAAVPSWDGGKMSLSSRLCDEVRTLVDEARLGRFDHPEMRTIRPLLEWQRAASILPRKDQLLIELTPSREDHHAFVYSFAGRLVHEALGSLLAHRLTRPKAASITATTTDYGVELMSAHPLPDDEAAWRTLLSTQNLLDELLASLNTTELARRQFRDIARVAGLVVQAHPGERRSVRLIQASSSMFYEVFTQFDPQNLLLDQAKREMLEGQLEVERLRATLDGLARMEFTIIHTEQLTPFAFPLWAETMRSVHATSEAWQDRVRKMAVRLEAEASSRSAGTRPSARGDRRDRKPRARTAPRSNRMSPEPTDA